MVRSAAGRLGRRLAVAASVVGLLTGMLVASDRGVSSASPSLLSSSTTSLTFVDDALTWPSFDTASSVSQNVDNPIYSLIYGNLFTIGPGDKAVPSLATGYKFSNNDLTLTLNLRSGVKFQDGTPFNSTAVKENFERDLSPKLGCKCISALTAIKSIATPTATEVVIQLSRPDGMLIPAMETFGPSFVTDPTALAKEGEKKFSLSPVGAGPFRLVQNIVNSSLTLDSWPGYWDAKAIHLKTIRVLSESNASTELATIQAGSAQLLYFTQDPTEYKDALADSSLRTTTSETTIGTNFVYLNPGEAPFSNRLAREAIFYATDESGISKAVFDGFAVPTEQLVGTSMQGFSGNKLPGFPAYNPTKAKALVKQLGGIKVTLLPLEDNTPGLEEAEALEKQWDAVGITTTINQETFPTVLSQMEKGDYQAIIAGYSPLTNAALALGDVLACHSFFDPDYCDNAVANDEKKAAGTVSVAQQGKLLRDAMTQSIVKDLAFLPLVQDPAVVVADKNLHGVQIYGGYLYMAEAYFG